MKTNQTFISPLIILCCLLLGLSSGAKTQQQISGAVRSDEDKPDRYTDERLSKYLK